MRITIDTEENARGVTGISTAEAQLQQSAEAPADGGAGQGGFEGTAGMDLASDAGGPAESLLETIAAAEAAGLTAASAPGGGGLVDAGAGPDNA
jgi:hypothetical protein